MLEVLEAHPVSPSHDHPILLVHGAWHGAWCWAEHFLPYLAEAGYDVYAPSLRGHGKSSGRDRLRWWRIADYVEDVKSVAQRLPASPIIIGHSMGGLVVQKYLEATSAPAAVLLASVPPRGVIGTTLRTARRHPLRFVRVNLSLSLYPLVETPALARELFFSADLPQTVVERYYTQLQDESYLGFLDMMGLNLPRPSRVRTPVLVLGGSSDTVFPPSMVEATARAYGTEAILFSSMAHDMMLEPGWQAVADKILAWLADKGL